MRFCVLIVACFLVMVSAPARGDDWPQWMGPQRDNVWRESGILERFPQGGPKILWRTPIAGGYAGPAVSQGRVFVTDYVTGDNVKIANFERNKSTGIERVLCLDERTGEILWKHEYPVEYTISYPGGPRCTPTVENGRVYTLGAEGHLFCFSAENGKVLWSKQFHQDYDAKTALWGWASHPLIDGQKLICVVGGPGSHAVAFDKESGRELWKSLTSQEQGYSPPTIITVGGVRQLILLRPDALTAVDPETGRPFWTVPYEASNGSIIMAPIQSGRLLYVAGYSNKNMLVKVAENGRSAEVVWKDRQRQAISPINVQPFLVDETLYGYDQNGFLYGVDLASGERLWQSGAALKSSRPVNSGTAFLVRQQDRFWLFNEQGDLIIARLTPEGYEELDRAHVIEPSNDAFGREVVWCAPAFANRRAYIRNDHECICVDLSADQ